MRHELGGYVDVYYVNGKAVIGEVREKRDDAADGSEPSVDEKIGGGRPQDECIEDVRHRDTADHARFIIGNNRRRRILEVSYRGV